MAAKQTKNIDSTERQAIIYARVSTSEQADSGLSLDAQKERCIGYCAANGWKVAAIHVDAGVSASTLDRPELEKALSALTPGSVLVVLKLDRLTRTVADLTPLSDRIEKSGAEWASVQERFDTSTATGRLMLRLIVELSQWEREVIGERTSTALQQKRCKKERLGTTPLGYYTAEDGTVAIDPTGQMAVLRARELHSNGLSLRQIAQQLQAEGHKTKKGGKWEAMTVSKLLKPRYLESVIN